MNTSAVTDSNPRLRLLVVMRLGDVKARDKLMPLLACSSVERVTLVRHAPVAIDSPKLRQVIHSSALDQGVAKMRPLRSLRNVLQCLLHGIRIARREKPDAVAAFNFTPYGVIAWLIARLSGSHAVVSLIGADFNTRLRQPVVGRVLRWVLDRCDRVVIFSEPARRDLIALGVKPQCVAVLPNSVDTQRFHPDPSVRPDFDLVFTGYLIPRKGVDRLLHALSLVRRQRAGTNLLVIGDGVERPTLEAMARQLEVHHAVAFHGWSDDVPGLLRRARLFVLLSEAEGLPIAMLEAMSTGLPVVVTDVGANRDAVEDGRHGYLVAAPAEPEVVADRILRLLTDEALYSDCREAALSVREKWGYDFTARTWEQVLRGLSRRG